MVGTRSWGELIQRGFAQLESDGFKDAILRLDLWVKVHRENVVIYRPLGDDDVIEDRRFPARPQQAFEKLKEKLGITGQAVLAHMTGPLLEVQPVPRRGPVSQ